ncbi:MAG: 4-(cytidine 5'-diphospho)-2-C-methyl-D-erythritol kinase [Bacteroidota bacterium]
MICFPNAKINLGLSVTNKRTDGMHDIETCYIPIPLYDVLEIKPSNKFSLTRYGLPLDNSDDKNIIIKAWELLISVNKNIKPVEVCLYKNIPIGSGLGGGSSDAAFFITAINSIFSLGITAAELELLASKIGADCPFFIKNKPTIATGTGNIFHPIRNPVLNMHLTVIFPNINLSTKNAFERITPNRGKELRNILNNNKSSWRYLLKNDFEEIAINEFPEIKYIKNTLYELGATYTSITGSGSAIYALSAKPLNTDMFAGNYLIWSEVLVL